jgi:hypothetical protein
MTRRIELFDRIIRATDPTLGVMVRVLIGVIAGIQVLLMLVWAVFAGGRGGAAQVALVEVVGYGLSLLIAMIPAVYAAALVGSQAGSDVYSLLSITEIAPREIVMGYYEGIQRRIEFPLRVLLLVVLLLGLVRSYDTFSTTTPYMPYVPSELIVGCVSVILPTVLILVYVNYLSRFAVAMGLWAGLRFRRAAPSMAVTVGVTLGMPVTLLALLLISTRMGWNTSTASTILCGAAMLPFIAPMVLRDRLLANAERWV